jgi:hypothetical protein
MSDDVKLICTDMYLSDSTVLFGQVWHHKVKFLVNQSQSHTGKESTPCRLRKTWHSVRYRAVWDNNQLMHTLLCFCGR